MPNAASRFRLTIRTTLALFIALSLALHIFLGVGSAVTEKAIQKYGAERAIRLAAEAKAKRLQAAKEKAYAAKRDAAEAQRQSKQALAAQLKQLVRPLTAKAIGQQGADQLWDQVLDQIDGDLDNTAEAMSDQNLSDADVGQQVDDIDAKALAAMAAELAKMHSQAIADSYVIRVRDIVVPRLANDYNQQIAQQVGSALRDEGATIIGDDERGVRSQRVLVDGAIGNAWTLVKSAQGELNGAQKRLAQARRSPAANPAQKRALAATTQAVAGTVAKATNDIRSAQDALKKADEGDQALSTAVRRAVSAAATQPDADDAVAKSGDAAAALQAGDIEKAALAASAAAGDAGKALQTIHLAATAMQQEHKADGDGGDAARLALRDARDSRIKNTLNESFKTAVDQSAVPRLTDALTRAFEQALQQAGVKDDAAVTRVRQQIAGTLGDDLAHRVEAGKDGTEAMTKAGNLNRPLADRWRADATTQPGNATTQPGDGDPRLARMTARINAAADAAAKQTLAKIAGDSRQDAALAKAAIGDDNLDARNLGDLSERFARMADNARGGHLDVADANAAPNMAGHAGPDGGAQHTGVGGGSGSGEGNGQGAGLPGRLARARILRLQRSFGGGLQLGSRFNSAEYAKLTDSIHNRDASAAAGEAIDLQSAGGPAAEGVAELIADTKTKSVAADLAAPAPATDAAAAGGKPEKDVPYRPTFANIRFAPIPFRSRPITIDGDLADWAGVPALPMLPAGVAAQTHSVPEFPEQVKVQWDNAGFYVAADVKKANNHITKVVSANFWEGDGLEVFVDSLNSKLKARTQTSHQFWAWVQGAINDPTQVGGENLQSADLAHYVPLTDAQMKVAGHPTASGWIIEMFIPKERFRQLRLEPGVIIGMNFSICTGTELYYYWAGSTEIGTSQRPDTWGDALLTGSDATVECVDRLASELKPTETAQPLKYLRIGQPLRIRVTDPVMNLSDTVKDRVSVSVKSDHGEPHTLVLEETSEKSGIFEGAIGTTLATGEEPDNAVALYDGESVQVSYVDPCRADGSRDVKVTLKIPSASSVVFSAAK